LFSVVRKHLLTVFLFIFCSAFQTIVNAQTVQGTVIDESGKPLPAVSVTVQGTSKELSPTKMEFLPFRHRLVQYWL
jgi:hypothetical protein